MHAPRCKPPDVSITDRIHAMLWANFRKSNSTVISLPSSVPSSPSGPSFGRRHSWSGGQQKSPPALTATPLFRASRSPSPSQPPDFNPSPPMLPSPYLSSPSANLSTGLSPRTSPSRPSSPRPRIISYLAIRGCGQASRCQICSFPA